MSVCKSYGKDKVIFATKEDHAVPSKIELPPSEASPGLLLPNGDINWNCPCLGGMATGPCGVEFREAFSCFHYSEAEPKGSDCYEKFAEMQDCFARYPTVYKVDDRDKDLDLEAFEDEGKKEPVQGGYVDAMEEQQQQEKKEATTSSEVKKSEK